MYPNHQIYEKSANTMIAVLLIALCGVTLYPFLYVLAYSFSDGTTSASRIITFLPSHPTFENYKAVFSNDLIVNAFGISVARTLSGTLLHLTVTGIAAYAISKDDLYGKKGLMLYFMIPMFVAGGLIPSYILINKLHLMNSFWVYILPGMYSTFHMIIIATFLRGLPDSLEESAKIDGAGDLTIFMKIVIPLSVPVFITIALFVGVAQWNSWFDAFLYMTDTRLHPLQTLLYKIMFEAQAKDFQQMALMSQGKSNVTPEAIKMSTLIVSVVPAVCVYPFLQKYFVKGVTMGAVKA
ncbi:carbohydrate ABC transporter permease [Cohnella hashimotonis]|uniref:Carbohydrate ABC transporter permease n=1 Tax=Cohnella hashimotonis TaxID=2826895 RepID=A0ABT6TQ72_9BACL|nr:carbohydrate ABC transporter permease [Cohnella hashimotonis]MDI4648460.1 carbohydrate ABC transporter permease [Cohnella hashimotonis]